MKTIRFQLNSNIVFGPDSLLELRTYLKEKKFSSISILIDENIEKNLYWQKTRKLLEKNFKIDAYILAQPGEPTYEYLDQVRHQFNEKTKCLIGIGGGSVMDTAKAVSVLVTNKKKAIDYRGFGLIKKDGIPLILIPTTAGTGSEVTPYAVFIDTKEKLKFGINSPLYIPILAIIDPKLMIECPISVSIASGMDALIHATESYISKKTNKVSQLFGHEAYRLLKTGLTNLVDDPKNIQTRSDLSLGAYYAGVALLNSSGGVIGALSYALGTLFKIGHGMAGAVFYNPVMEMNMNKGFNGYSDLFPSKDNKTMLKESAKFTKKLKIPDTLGIFGMRKNDIPRFLKHLESIWVAIDLNPVSVTKKDIESLLYKMI